MNNTEFEKVHNDIINKLPNNIAMITNVWGPPTWFFLHSMAMSYPKKIDLNNSNHRRIKNAMFAFLSNLGDILPCPLCGVSYNTYIREPGLSIIEHLNTRASLIEFIYKIHNKVNKKLGVPQCDIPSFKEVVDYYSQFIAGVPCKATTDEERQKRLLLGCSNDDIKNGKFKNFSCSVNVVNKNNNSDVYLKDNKNIENKEEFANSNHNHKKCNNFWTILFAIIAIIFIIISILLYLQTKKLSK